MWTDSCSASSIGTSWARSESESAVTLFCRGTGPGAARTAHDVLAGLATAVDVDGVPDDWTELRASYPEGMLVATRLERAPDSPSSRIILGAFQHFRDVETSAEASKVRVLDVVKNAQTLLGVRVVPHFVSRNDSRWTGLKEAAGELDGLVFDGDAMRDADGLVVLGSDGRSVT